MKKSLLRLILILIGIFIPFGARLLAQNPRSVVKLNSIIKKLERNKNNLKVLAIEDKDSLTHYPVILEISDKNADEVLERLNAVVFHSRKNLYLTAIPIDNLEALPRDKGVDNFSISNISSVSLDISREVSGVNAVHRKLIEKRNISSAQLSVVTGICDVGFDPRHEAFRNSLKKWVIYDEYRGLQTEYEDYANIVRNGPLTDDITKTHATHVGAILAGSATDTPYYGVAPSSNFVATVSRLSDVGICAGIEDIIKYSKEVGQPAVVNISAGSYLGPHDGTDLVGRYLDSLSEDAIICLSAGNYGQRNNCQSLDLDNYTEPIGSAWCDMSWLGFEVDGGTDIWSADDTPFEFRLVAWDLDTKEFLYVSDWMGGEKVEGEYFFDLESTPWFDSGGVWAAWNVSPENNRFNVAFEYDYKSSLCQSGHIWARYAVGYHIRPIEANTHVDVYSDGIRSFLHGMGISGCIPGDSNGSISNLACGPHIVSVGAWTSRSVVPDIEFGSRDLGLKVQTIAPWSAYGATIDGRKLPLICAPGNIIVSAMSTPHSSLDAEYRGDAAFTAFEHNGYRYYAEAGTSMSSPIAAGIIALWLSVNPSLTVSDIQSIILSTANTEFIDINDPRWGAGAIDAMAGLTMVSSSIDTFMPETSNPTVRAENGQIIVFWPGVDNPQINIIDILGRMIPPNSGESLTTGIYIVNVCHPSGKGPIYSTKILL